MRFNFVKININLYKILFIYNVIKYHHFIYILLKKYLDNIYSVPVYYFGPLPVDHVVTKANESSKTVVRTAVMEN